MKARIELDWFAARATSRLGWVLLGLGLVAALGAVERHLSWSSRAEQLEAESQQFRQSARRAAIRVREPARDQVALQQEVRSANRVVDQLTVPWPELFRDLESVSDRTVALLAIQPDSATRSVRLEGEARDFKAVLGFVERLEGTPAFSTVYLASHQVRVDLPSRPVGFALASGWSGDAR